MRDKIKGKTYFQNYILEEEEGINYYRNRLEEGTIKEERIEPVKKEIYRLKCNILVAKYSVGESIDTLKKMYIELLREASNFWNQDTYDFNANFIGLAVLFNCEELIPNEIKEFLTEKSETDWVFAALSEEKGELPSNDVPLLFQSEFEGLKIAIANKDTGAVAKYIKKDWYELHKDCGWYNSHKSKQNVYKGYWCFEVAALVKKYGIDDESFKDYDYYPYDLVHFDN